MTSLRTPAKLGREVVDARVMTSTGEINGLLAELTQAEMKAWDSLARYKFQMFGYWAAIWVHFNRIGNLRRPNPWKMLVDLARTRNFPAADAFASSGNNQEPHDADDHLP